MKLKNFILSMIAVSMFFTCSSDDDPVIPAIQNATLSLATNVPVTKAVTDADIAKLTVGVYNAAGDYLTSKDSVDTKEVVNIVVPNGGNVKILVFANLGDVSIVGESLADAMALVTDLSKEEDGQLTMSSQVYSASLSVDKHNYMGYANNEKGEGNYFEVGVPVKLYRNVAKVQMVSLTVKENTQYGTAVKFVLDTIFVANVKGESQLANEAAWGAVEATAPAANAAAFWRYGAYADLTGSFKNIVSGTVPTPNNLVYDFVTGDKQITINSGSPYPAEPATIGDFFYVYESMKEAKGAQTLFVLRGAYTYIPVGETEPVTENDRFYAVAVTGNGTTDGHIGVKRNYRYDLAVTITGPGSDDPYTPSELINLNAEVVVKNWNAPIGIDAIVE